jgi:hypothetical protein
MHTSLTDRRIREAKTAIADRFSAGEQFHSTYERIYTQAHACVPANLPQWAKAELRGYTDAKCEALWRMVDFRYEVNGEWIKASELEYGPECREPKTCSHSGHYVAIGTDRPFTTPRPVSS